MNVRKYKSYYDSRPRSGVQNKIIKRELFKKHNGRCFYCGIITVIYKHVGRSGLFPKNMATVDHIYSKWDIRRALSKKVVLCCYKCNNEKNTIEMEEINKNYRYNLGETDAEVECFLKNGVK